MGQKMTKQSRKELLETLRPKYFEADWTTKGELLRVFVEATGYNHKYAIHLLNAEPRTGQLRKTSKRYNKEVKAAVAALWEASNGLCSKRLVPIIPELTGVLVRLGYLQISDHDKEMLFSVSPATVDRMLKKLRYAKIGSRGFTRPGNLLKNQIRIRTFTEWDDAKPGFFEADLVAHSGCDPSGQFLQTLTLTDISTQWTECVALLRRGELEVRTALQELEPKLPVPFLGLDTDNGYEFINYNLLEWCKVNSITFTRGRPYKKNDQAHVEERNGSVVRKYVGYDRLEGRIAHRILAQMYETLRLYQNFFQPSQKLVEKKRTGAKVYKKHDRAKTPYQRILESQEVDEKYKLSLKKQYEKLDPVKLLKGLKDLQKQLEGLALPSLFPRKRRMGDRLVKASLREELRIITANSDKMTVREIIKTLPPGTILQAIDLLHFDTRLNVDYHLGAMYKRKELEKIGWGVYKTPGPREKKVIGLSSKKIREAMVSE